LPSAVEGIVKVIKTFAVVVARVGKAKVLDVLIAIVATIGLVTSLFLFSSKNLFK
jgi:hypothetical protein